MSDIAIKIENVSKEYRIGAIGGTTLREEVERFADKLFHRVPVNPDYGKKFMALQDINLEVKKGERLGIIGHNGAGKSTLLKLLARVTGPTTGTISYNGRISSMLEVGTGFHAELTGRENVYMNGAILGMRKKEIDRKIDDIIAFAEMEKFIDTPVKRYSSGMYVKLAFAVAAHLDNEILIMDEVLAVGDMKFQQKCLGKMDDASKQNGKTVLYVSHNMNTIRQLCERCIVLKQGKILFEGNVEESIERYISEVIIQRSNIIYTNYQRKEYINRSYLDILSAKYENKDDCNFKDAKILNFILKIKTKMQIKNLCFRFLVERLDGTRIGAAFVEDVVSCDSDKIYEMRLYFDISNLVSGKYKTHYVFFISNALGAEIVLDSVPGLDIVVEKKNKLNLIWQSSIWGNFEIPSIKTEIL